MGKTQDIPQTGGFMTTETNAQTPSDTPRTDAFATAMFARHDPVRAYKNGGAEEISDWEDFAKLLERALALKETDRHYHMNAINRLAVHLDCFETSVEVIDCAIAKLTAAESALAEVGDKRDYWMGRAHAAESALEKMRESNGDLLMRNVELRHRLDAAERDAALLDWLEANHFYEGQETGPFEQTTSDKWIFYVPKQGKSWQPIRDKISAALSPEPTATEKEK